MHYTNNVPFQRFLYLTECFDITPYHNEVLRQGWIKDHDVAAAAGTALLQWLALPDHDDAHEVLLEGPVAMMFRAFVLDTANYEAYCKSCIGSKLYPIPVTTVQQRNFIADKRWFETTMAKLNVVYGAELSPLLSSWCTFDSRKNGEVAMAVLLPRERLQYPKLHQEQPFGAKSASHTHGMTAV